VSVHRRTITDLQSHPDANITVQAFARYLDVQDKTVMKWIRAGVLPAHQFPPDTPGGEIRIRKVDAVAFVERARILVP
jgi:excisionase family DNA binding protein